MKCAVQKSPASHSRSYSFTTIFSLCKNIKLVYPCAFSGKSAWKRSLGFTLVEILIIVAILGIALAVAVPNLFPSDDEQVRQESERLIILLDAVRDEAAFSGVPLAVRIGDDGIRFWQRDSASVETKWIETQRANLQPRQWRDGVRASIMLTENTNTKAEHAAITFLPAGVGTPFRLQVFSTSAGNQSASFTRIIEGDALGNMRFAAAVK